MKSSQITHYWFILAVSVLTLLLLCQQTYLWKNRIPKDLGEYTEIHGSSPVTFSIGSGFYEGEISLEISAPGRLPEGAAIYYTLDGTDPTAASIPYEAPLILRSRAAAAQEGAKKDSGSKNDHSKDQKGEKAEKTSRGGEASVLLPVPEGSRGYETLVPEGAAVPESAGGAKYKSDNPASATCVYTIRAGICQGEETVGIETGVYCLGRDLIESRILRDEEYIICVESEPSGLYDFDKGILVGGSDYAEKQSKYSGNFMKSGQDWVKACQAAVFDSQGNLLTSQSAGLSVSGGMSRRLDQKSFNLAAGLPFGEEGGRFELDLFDDLPESDCAHVGSYTHLRLRARSQVMRTFRESLTAQLAIESGYPSVSTPRSAVVFLNGSFYMLAEIEPTFSNSWLAHRFDLPDSQHILKKKGKESSVLKKMGVADLFAADLTKKENRAALEAAVDMDNYLLYYAINVLDNNLDWPRNNVQAWRYEGDYDPSRRYTDGRLRFTLYDSDRIYNTDLSITDIFGTDNFVSMMEDIKRGYQSRFRDVMRSEEYRNRFVTIVCDLMNTSFDTEHVISLMEEECAAGQPEYGAFYEESYLSVIEEEMTAAVSAAEERNGQIRQDFGSYFGLGKQYRMEISASEGVSVQWAGRDLSPGEVYACDYYAGIPVKYTAVASPGWKFSHWETEVNGKTIRNGKSSINIDGSVAGGEGFCLRAVARREEGERLIIAEVSAAGDDDWIRLYNAGTVLVNLGQYCLSDEPDIPQKFRLPMETLDPGESCLVNGSKRAGGENALCSCSFMLSRDEILTLTPDEGRNLTGDSLRIPRMSADSSYGRKDNGSLYCWFDRRGSAERPRR